MAETIAGIGTDNAVMDETVVQDIREDLGLDRPVVVRYLSWLGYAVRGELGKSYQTGQSVSEAIALRLPVTIQLLLMAQILAILLAINTFRGVQEYDILKGIMGISIVVVQRTLNP